MGEAMLRLLERTHELERLAALSGEAVAGRGSVVVLEGPAGIGKTSMLAAARDVAEQFRMGVSLLGPGRPTGPALEPSAPAVCQGDQDPGAGPVRRRRRGRPGGRGPVARRACRGRGRDAARSVLVDHRAE